MNLGIGNLTRETCSTNPRQIEVMDFELYVNLSDDFCQPLLEARCSPPVAVSARVFQAIVRNVTRPLAVC